jgi:transcriptional regulator with XRE-family HTH domain
MKQPALGQRLVSLRKEKNLTQEELVERSNVSVRTIQRIESGEVIPRLSTIKIIAKALEVDFESIVQTNQNQMEENRTLVTSVFKPTGDASKTALITATISGAIYLVLEIIKTTFDIVWMMSPFKMTENIIYVAIVVGIVVTYLLFLRGFIVLSHLFENGLLRIVCYLLVLAMLVVSTLDVYSFFYVKETADFSMPVPATLLLPYIAVAVMYGVLGIIFGTALLKLQDGMGELSKVAGILEIIMGVFLATVVLFYLAFPVMIPATILEIILLYRGYEYLSKAEASVVQSV